MRMCGFMFLTFLTWSLPALAATTPVLRDDSYGAIRFGDKLTTAERTLGEKASAETISEGCDYASFKSYPQVRFMVVNQIVTRVDVRTPGIPTSLGIRIGTPLAEVKRRYPQVLIEPNKYDEKGHNLIFRSKDGKRAFVFYETKGVVQHIQAGQQPSVEWVEGCL